MEKKALPMMSFVESIATCFKKYVTFKGRARRSEYWWFWIIPYLVSAGAGYLFQWKLAQRALLESQIVDALFDEKKHEALLAQASSVDSIFTTWIIVIAILWLVLLLPS